MKQTKIVGDGWKIYVDARAEIWRGDGDGVDVPLKMLLGHIGPEEIKNYSVSSTYLGRQYGMLYPDAAEFLNKWGIKCSVENLPPIIHEAMTLPDVGAPD